MYNPTDEELARENVGMGQVITRTPAQIAAYRAQIQGDSLTANALQSAMARGNPFSVPTYNAGNRFESALTDSGNRVNALLDNPDSIQQSAAYKFRLGQGMEALQRSLGAKGLLNSGNRLTAMNDYAQGVASQEYGNQFNRLASLYGQNAQGYIGDKNANTALYSAQTGAYNTAQRNNDAAQLGWGELSLNSKKPGMNPTGMNTIYRSISQSGGGVNSAFGGYWDPETDPAIARMRQARIDADNY